MKYQQDNKHSWYRQDTRTITLSETYVDFEDFVAQSGIENNEDYETIFNQLYNLYNDNYTYYNTPSYLSQWLRFYMEQEYDKYKKINDIWDNEIEALTGKLSEINGFTIGDIKEDIENYDKYKNGRQTQLIRDDVLSRIKDLQQMRTPFETLINNIAIRVFQQFEVQID